MIVRMGERVSNQLLPLPLREGVGGGVRTLRYRGHVHPSPYPLPQGEGEEWAGLARP